MNRRMLEPAPPTVALLVNQRIQVGSWRVHISTPDPDVGIKSHLCPNITLYENNTAQPVGPRAKLFFVDSLTELRAASLDGVSVNAYFHSAWYQPILDLLKAGEICDYLYSETANQSWLEFDGLPHAK